MTADPPGLRLSTLRHWLADHLDGFEPDAPMSAQLMAGGRSNLTYRLGQAGQEWVLRRPPLGHVMESAHDMGREHRVLTGLTAAGFPAPRPLGLCDDPDVIGAPFMVMDFVAGRVIATAEDAAGLSASEAAQTCAAFIDNLARLHRLDVSQAGLIELGRPQGYLERQVRRWTAQWETTKTQPLPHFDELARRVAERVQTVPDGLPWSLVHGDFRLDNLILDPVEPRVLAVLDWEMSTLGDPVSDLAVSLVYWSRPGEPLRHKLPVADGVTDGPGFWERDRLVQAYQSTTGLSLDHLDLCLALACLKLAVIMESIHFRNLAGAQMGAAARGAPGAMGAATPALVAMGLQVARGGGLDALSS